MKLQIAYLFFLIFVYSAIEIAAQGCSDAGACTLHTFGAQSKVSDLPSNFLAFGISQGKADFSIGTLSSFIDFRRKLSSEWQASLRLTSLYQSGELANSFGLGDIYLTTDYSIPEVLIFTVGIKYPLNTSDNQLSGRVLPMDYQSSLGTMDVVLGATKEISDFKFSLIYQAPITQNENSFFASEFPTESTARDYPTTNNFERSPDIILRVLYTYKMNESFSFSLGILPIYHISNDRYTNEIGETMEIEGSKGLTLNSNFFINYLINKNNSLNLTFGAPLKVRDTRPDGLTRSYVVGLEYMIGI